jgi:hypothetical protein
MTPVLDHHGKRIDAIRHWEDRQIDMTAVRAALARPRARPIPCTGETRGESLAAGWRPDAGQWWQGVPSAWQAAS